VDPKLLDAGNRGFGMIGSSLGGLLSCYSGWTRPKIWKVIINI